jgi:hypothetical protein
LDDLHCVERERGSERRGVILLTRLAQIRIDARHCSIVATRRRICARDAASKFADHLPSALAVRFGASDGPGTKVGRWLENTVRQLRHQHLSKRIELSPTTSRSSAATRFSSPLTAKSSCSEATALAKRIMA